MLKSEGKSSLAGVCSGARSVNLHKDSVCVGLIFETVANVRVGIGS